MDADVKAAAARHDNLKVIFKDAQNSSLTQRAQVEEFVDQGVDLIIISPKEAAPLTRPVAEAYKQGIPVIVLDREVQGGEYTSFIDADNVRIGREAGMWISPTGGDEAIDAALSILRGETVRKKIVLGTRLFTRENIAQGGVAIR